jgi:hypothetical protein
MRVCKFCRQGEDEHHEFESIPIPEGCLCDPWEWEPNPIGPICAQHKGPSNQNCSECEHNSDCHLRGEGEK